MHSLEVLIYRNERAAGRELAHRLDDGESHLLILEAAPIKGTPEWHAFCVGVEEGRRDG